MSNYPLGFFAAGLLLIASLHPAVACLNDYRPNLPAIDRSRSTLRQLTDHSSQENWIVREYRLRDELVHGGDYRVKNDLATALAHNGKAKESIVLLEQIEAEQPGLYATAANLGTTYELAKDNQKALTWIRKGIELNPKSHIGSEWLHVRILEAKIAMKDDPTATQACGKLGRQIRRSKHPASSSAAEGFSPPQLPP